MNAVLLCVIVGALISLFSRLTSASFFVQSPTSLATYDDGTEVELVCRVVDADGVVWTINGTRVRELNDPSISVSQQTETTTTGNEVLSTLSIVASSRHDNSLMQCKTVGHSEVSSDAALLRVQGLLSAPTNMRASHPNSSAIHLCWDPPFTLDITNEDPDIPGYTVSITNNNTKVTRERNVTEPEFIFQEEGYDPCHVYLFRVRAWNPVGVGEPSDVINECFGKAPQSANINWTVIDSSAEEQTTLQLIITYDMSCHGGRPESIEINIILNDGSQMSMDLHTVPNNGRLDLQLDFSTDNIPCSVSVTLRNQFGNTDTDVKIEDECQLGVTDDVGGENPAASDDGIPLYAIIIVAGASLLVVSALTVVIGIMCWLKIKMSTAEDHVTIEMKGNAAYEVHQLPHTRPQPVQLQPCAAYGVISSH